MLYLVQRRGARRAPACPGVPDAACRLYSYSTLSRNKLYIKSFGTFLLSTVNNDIFLSLIYFAAQS